VFIDGTHIKASANLNKKIKQEVPVAAKRYREELLVEVNADREVHGKNPSMVRMSRPDPRGRRGTTSQKGNWHVCVNNSKKHLTKRFMGAVSLLCCYY